MLLAHVIMAPLAVAQQATPASTPGPRPRPSRPVCDARPASPAGLITVLAQPLAEDPAAVDPHGEAVPPAERAPLGDLVGRWKLCLASGNVRGLLGLFSADGVRRLLGERSPYVGGPAGMNVSILSVGDVVRMDDGRLAGRVSVDPSGQGTSAPESLLMIIEQGSDGAWHIDDLRAPPGPVGATAPASPQPGAAARPLLRHPISPGPNVAIPAPGPAVPLRGGDAARTGNQPGPLPEGEPALLWRAPTGWSSAAQPVVARGLVFFGGFSLGQRNSLLEAVDAASGGVRWQTTAPVAWAEIPATPALAGDALFAPVQAPVAGILATAAATGQALWFAPFGFMSLTAPAADTDTVYVAGWGLRNPRDRASNAISGAVIALDQRTGRERWRYLARAHFGPVTVGRQAVYVPSDKGLYALDRATGAKRWQSRFSPRSGQTAALADKVVAFAGVEITTGLRGVFALDADSGALLWRVDLPGATGVAAAGDTVYVSGWDAAEGNNGGPTLRALALEGGDERWVVRVGPDSVPADAFGAISEPVIVAQDILIGVAVSGADPALAELNGLYAIDSATGELRWHAADVPIGSTPAALNGTIFAISGPQPRSDAVAGNLLAFGAD